MPTGFEIKGNADSMLYHVPGSAFYDRTVAEIWFATVDDAEAAGYELPPSQRDDDDAADSAIADAGEPKTATAVADEDVERGADDESRSPAASGQSDADRRGEQLMGQKINPYGFRLGITHRLEEPLVLRARVQGLPHRGLEDPPRP